MKAGFTLTVMGTVTLLAANTLLLPSGLDAHKSEVKVVPSDRTSVIQPLMEYAPASLLTSFNATQDMKTPLRMEQTLRTPEAKDAKTIDLKTESIMTLPKLDELTNDPKYNLSTDEYWKVVTEGRSFDIRKTIASAYSEVGQSFPTGWAQPGECIESVSRWIKNGGGTWGEGGTPLSNYSTAKQIPLASLQAGDVIQYVNTANPSLWADGVHTVLIAGNNFDGTYKIVESNVPTGSGLVSKNDSWKPHPPAGWEAIAFRF